MIRLTERAQRAALPIVQEYLCGEHGKFEMVERCNEDESPRACPTCGLPAPYTVSAPATRMPVATIRTGKSDERPPNALDTRPLAEGMSSGEWHRNERKKSWEMVRAKQRKVLT